ncbi:MAG: PEP-utilizing enzyme [Nanoarchaeota archaeon]
MQHLKFEYRKLINDLALGQNSILSEVLRQIVMRTNREDSISMTAEEVEKLLKDEKVKDCSDRDVYSFVEWDNEKRELMIIAGGEAYKKIRELEKEMPKGEVIGTPACKGFAKGKVRIIPFSMNPEEYLHKFQKGEILVSTTTGPEMVIIIEKAAAIVTDEGGLMSHAAIVSREFGIPCVVGTKYATEVFKNGDEIEVNANNGVVRKI